MNRYKREIIIKLKEMDLYEHSKNISCLTSQQIKEQYKEALTQIDKEEIRALAFIVYGFAYNTAIGRERKTKALNTQPLKAS